MLQFSLLLPPMIVFIIYAWFPKRIPAKVFAIVGILLLIWNIITHTWLQGLWSALAVLLLLTIGITTKLLKRLTLFAFASTAIGIPLTYWWIFIPGLVLALLVATIKLQKTGGKGYLRYISGETMSAIGYGSTESTAGLIPKPDLSRLPLPSEENPPLAEKQTIPLIKYVATGSFITLLIAIALQTVRF